MNPGPKNKLSIIHWNLNSSYGNHSRKTAIEAFNTNMNFDIIAISETGLHQDRGNDHLEIEGFTIYRRNLPNDRQYGGVLVYVNDSIACQERPDLETISSDQLIVELTIDRKKVFVSTNYRRHHPDRNSLNLYMENFQKSCENVRAENPFCSIHIGDFNSHNTEWCNSDTTDLPGELLNDILNEEALAQLVDQPTYLTSYSSTLLDLVITDNPNVVNKCTILPSLDPRCHHQINSLELNIANPPPPSITRRIWHYDRANWESINQAISSFDWVTKLTELSYSPDLQVSFFNETLMNIFSNFIPNEYKKINKRNPPWFTKNLTIASRRLSRAYKKYKNRGYPAEMKNEVDGLRKLYTDLIETSKNNYLKTQGYKLLTNTASKKYWHILKGFISSYVVPVIPPLKLNNVFVSDFQQKAEEFNKYFSDQCTLLDNDSTLPHFTLLTNKKLSNCHISETRIHEILSKLDINKSHGCDNISSRMLKLSAATVCKPLSIIYRNCLLKGVFPSVWKLADVTPIHKKNEKNIISNYRPISLLPICSKVFEKIIYDTLYAHVIENKLISWRQSGFIKSDSTINQLLAITEMIRKSFDCEPPKEVRAIFLDISKAFDKVWHDGLIFKLKQNGVNGYVLDILSSFLTNRKQRTLINGKFSSWRDVQAGVPQGSVLGPLLFLIYINDITQNMKCDARIFADDTSIFKIVENPTKASQDLGHDLNLVQVWAHQWKMSFNPDPTKPPVEMIFSTKTKQISHPPLSFNGIPLQRVSEHKHLGVKLDIKLNFESHINEICNKTSKLLGVMKMSRLHIPISALENVYKFFVRSVLEYGDVLYSKSPFHSKDKHVLPLDTSLTKSMQKLESVQYKAARIITGTWKGSSTEKIYSLLGW